ncbi:type VII secretion protein EccB [Amycolatopsis anabasis]|uniref:type VII secretion protein EccB n=1 Tax=Amycolatopsis anabasis TaxID=1840409 RepID=UPI00131D6FC8|nr:type VII secretion protein EccB [Amycolatopsis anabasis]
MWTQRDQIQAYQFLRRRLVSALVAADANHPVSPSRRLVLGTVLGLAVALLVTAVFGVIGLLSPSGGKNWLSGGHVIVEEETGARFVLGQDGALHPVLNYASARLLAGGSGESTVTVPAKKLATAPRGATVGIPGAPDSLPAAGRLVPAEWTTCSRTSQDTPSAAEPASTVLFGVAARDGELPRNQGLLVRLPAGERYLITAGHRFRLSQDAVVALGYEQRMPIVVSRRWLNTVPAGRDLAFVAVDGAGRKGPDVGGKPTRVGQVLAVTGATGGTGYYLVRADGLEVITETEAALIPGNPANADAYRGRSRAAVPAEAADVARVPRAGGPADRTGGEDPAGYPDRVPPAATVTGGAVTICASGDESATRRITVSGRVPLPAGGRAVVVNGRPDDRVADEVYVPPSGGTVAAEQASPGVASGTVYLVTDTGFRFPVSSPAALAALGYGSAPKRGMPAAVLALAPTGPALDPAAAQQVSSGSGSG